MNLRSIGIFTLDYPNPVDFHWTQNYNNFCVEEIRNNDIASINNNNTYYSNKNGEYLYFVLVKKNLSTIRAIDLLSKKLSISRKRFRYAGIKDKNATTAQWISVFDPDKKIEVALKEIKSTFFKIYVVGREEKPIKIGDLDGNRFTIRLTNFTKADNINDFINFANKYGIRNYYGMQHFGKDAINLKISLLFVKGMIGLAAKELENNNIIHFSSKDYNKYILQHKDLLLLIVQAYQKYLFNKLLSKQDIYKKDELPVPGYDFLNFNLKEEETIKKILEEDNVDYHELYLPSIPDLSMHTFFRKARFFPKNFSYSKDDNGIVLSFILDKGSYASILMAELTGGKVN